MTSWQTTARSDDRSARIGVRGLVGLVKLVVTEDEGAAPALEIELARVPTTLVTSRIAVIEVTRTVRLVDPAQVSEAEVLLASCSLFAVSDAILGVARRLTSPCSTRIGWSDRKTLFFSSLIGPGSSDVGGSIAMNARTCIRWVTTMSRYAPVCS